MERRITCKDSWYGNCWEKWSRYGCSFLNYWYLRLYLCVSPHLFAFSTNRYSYLIVCSTYTLLFYGMDWSFQCNGSVPGSRIYMYCFWSTISSLDTDSTNLVPTDEWAKYEECHRTWLLVNRLWRIHVEVCNFCWYSPAVTEHICSYWSGRLVVWCQIKVGWTQVAKKLDFVIEKCRFCFSGD